jgi:acetyl esterase/lipase
MKIVKRLLLVSALFATAAAVAQDPAPPPKAELRRRPSPIPEGCKVLRDLSYGPHDRNKLDLYVPKSDAPLPLVIWVHGGGWEGGSKNGGGPSLDLLRKGYAVASINYRLSWQDRFPAQIQDCKAAVRWLRANAKEYNLDADHFGAWGASAGGHLVALLGTTPDECFLDGDGKPHCSALVQAVCDWFGPTDFLHWGSYTIDDPIARRPSAISRLLGGVVPDKMELAKKASPVCYVGKSSAPFLIAHGDKDPVVPLQQSEDLNEALKKAGVESSLRVIKGNGHGGAGFMAADLLADEDAFFAKYLKQKAAK